jgi:hypothetical protein
MIGSSCATLETGKEGARFAGVTGIVVPVDTQGKEIVYQEKQNIRIDLIPIVNGEKEVNRTVSINPRADGSFTRELGNGNYAVEIFLEGFYVKSFTITIRNNELLDLGVINIQKIETELGAPLKEGQKGDTTINEGDVTIEPPSM